MLEPLRVIVSWDGDHIGRVVGRATLNDDVEEVRRVDQTINRGNEVFKGWALAHGGSIIEIGGDEGRIEIPVDAIKDLPEVRHAYFTAVDATVTVGIGKKLSESAKALLAGKNRGGDTVVFYDKDIETEIAGMKEETETEKISKQYLMKAVEGSAQSNHAGGVSAPHKAGPVAEASEHSQGEAALAMAQQAPEASAVHPLLADFHGAALGQDQADRAAAVQQSADFQQLKEQTAAALAGLRTQLPVLAQLKTAYPDTYKSVITLVQSVVGLARGLQSTDEQLTKSVLQKKEPKPKVYKEDTGGFGSPVSIPGIKHPDRPAYDKAYLGQISEQYGAYDLKDVDIAHISGGNSGRGVANKDRYKLYHKMYAAGDSAPPVILSPTPSGGYEMKDGTHRLEAAKAAKVKTISAAVLKNDLIKGVAGIKPQKTTMTPDQGYGQKKEFDYSHLLPPHAQQTHELSVSFSPENNTLYSQFRQKGTSYAEGQAKGHIIGVEDDAHREVSGSENHPGIEPHSYLNEEHKGKGVGTAMYEALYAHAKNEHDIHHVYGGIHSRDAHALHDRLAKKHGFEVHGGGQSEIADEHSAYPHESYGYALKGEMMAHEPDVFSDPVFVKKASLQKDDLHLPSHSPHNAVNLPVGTTHHGKVKVRHSDGTEGWKGVRAGMVQGQEAGAPLFGANSHPVSSREPGSK